MQDTHEIFATAPESAPRRQLLLAATFLNAPAALTACSSREAVQTSAGTLKSRIRFSADEALGSADGLLAGASPNPVSPKWLGGRLMSTFFTPKSENERYARQIRKSSGIALFVSERSNKTHWVESGRCFERFALQATASGFRNAFVNQPVEACAIRSQFAQWLGLSGQQRPDLVGRFGRGPVMPMSLRRPVQAVVV